MKIFTGWREAGRAMRWARRQDDVHLTVDQLSRGRVMWTWEKGDDFVGLMFDPQDHDVVLKAGTAPFCLRLDTSNTSRKLGVLAELGLLPPEFGAGYRTGYAHGRADLARQLDDERRGLDIVRATGHAAFRAIPNGGGTRA